MNKNLNELMETYKDLECTYLQMECAFTGATGDDPMNNNSISDLLDNKSTSFSLEDSEDNINVEYDIVKRDEDDLGNTIIKIINIEII